MNDIRIQEIVGEVIGRLMPHLGADGRRGTVIVVFSGATVRLPEAVGQVRRLILDGYRAQLVFTAAAEGLYAGFIRDQLAGFPYDELADGSRWLSILRQARAVLVPLLSVNTLSKLVLLMADNVPLNLILHALFMGKPVIMARNGADPADRGREQLGFSRGTAALTQTLRERLRTAANFGCCLSDVSQLRRRLRQELGEEAAFGDTHHSDDPRDPDDGYRPGGKLVTAGHVRRALRLGADLMISSDSVITPLARDLIRQHRLTLAVGDPK